MAQKPSEKRPGLRRIIRLPDLQRVPRPPRAKNPPPDAPVISAGAEVRTDARLRDAAAKISSGNRSLLRAMYPQGIGTTPRGLRPEGDGHPPGICQHYLPDNRFAWWDVGDRLRIGAVPEAATGMIPTGVKVSGDLWLLWLCEFSPLFATVVGAAVPTPDMVQRHLSYHTISWDGVPPGASPNMVPDIEFTVATPWAAISEVNVFVHEMPVDDRGNEQRLLQKVLVNQAAEVEGLAGPETLPDSVDVEYTPDASVGPIVVGRPPLVIVFDHPQRAVGLEYGFIPFREGRATVPGNNVELVARDRDGAVLVRTSGARIGDVEAFRVDNRIGVRHQDGGISSVELHFNPDEAAKPSLELQIVSRIWHEPFPPAAIQQGTLEGVWNVPDVVDRPGEIAVRLPFRCDKAVAIMRGFKVKFIDQPHQIDGLRVGVVAHENNPGDGQVTLRPYGGPFFTDAATAVKIYYTLIAWDSEQAELFHGGADANFSEVTSPDSSITSTTSALREAVFQPECPSDLHAHGAAMRPDPCPNANPYSGALSEQACGRLTGGPTGFGFRFSHDQDLNHANLSIGIPVRADDSNTITWPMAGTAAGADEEGSWSVQGVVITGRSLVPGSEPSGAIPFLERGIGPRTDDPDTAGHWLWTSDQLRQWGMSAAVQADLGFVGLAVFQFALDGPVGELEVEVQGSSYDGAVIDWQLGVGAGPGERNCAIGWPRFGGVVRQPRGGGPTLHVQELRFERGVVGLVSLTPAQCGAISNAGEAPAFIGGLPGGLREGGPQFDEFDFRFVVVRGVWQLDGGDVFSLADWPNRSPVVLWPGDTLLIGGQFRPQGNGPRRASLTFFTNDPSNMDATMPAIGNTVPSQARGDLLPAAVDFGILQPGESYQHNFVITSLGETPLLLRTLRLEDPTQGFRIEQYRGDPPPPGAPIQIEPGDSYYFHVTFSPPIPSRAPYATRMIAETNAGEMGSNLSGFGALPRPPSPL